VFAGRHRREDVARDTGLSQPKYPASDLGQSVKREKILLVCLWLPPCSLIPSCILFLQLLSRGSADVPTLLAEVTREWEAAAAAVVLAAKTLDQEAAAARDNATLCVKDAEDRAALRGKDAEDWAALTEREA
jgi:hypothetical protein